MTKGDLLHGKESVEDILDKFVFAVAVAMKSLIAFGKCKDNDRIYHAPSETEQASLAVCSNN